MDNSYSMVDSLGTAKKACHRLVGNLINVTMHRVSIVSFNSSVYKHCDLTHDLETLKLAIDDIQLGSSTNMAEAFTVAGSILKEPKGIPLVIIMTDGFPDDKTKAINNAEELKNKGIRINAIGAGSVDQVYLKSIASSPQEYYQINDMNGLAGAFAKISNSLKLQ